MTKRALILTSILALASCAAPKTPYVSDAREPNDLPPSPRYSVVMIALRDELPRHSTKGEFYLCQGPEQVAALQRDLPEFTLRHASETYTAPVKDWPGLSWSHRRSDDALATRVTTASTPPRRTRSRPRSGSAIKPRTSPKCTTPSAAPAPPGSS